ncbi:hypothetical protein B0H66DRAFT_536304 [Apodospora peruviana]|uniref:F-box domain-containing protein n=1 Tax=Apodospora peruviana TaxID=516989 RepID=A0AAE0HYS5_9PEZI|nr:hypothetical protein B0H66DRAFT_536304 [Apodospora peruviana]
MEHLPAEILVAIAEHLPVEGRAALALTSRTILFRLGNQVLRPVSRSNPSRRAFLILLERDGVYVAPDMLILCPFCDKFHKPPPLDPVLSAACDITPSAGKIYTSYTFRISPSNGDLLLKTEKILYPLHGFGGKAVRVEKRLAAGHEITKCLRLHAVDGDSVNEICEHWDWLDYNRWSWEAVQDESQYPAKTHATAGTSRCLTSFPGWTPPPLGRIDACQYCFTDASITFVNLTPKNTGPPKVCVTTTWKDLGDGIVRVEAGNDHIPDEYLPRIHHAYEGHEMRYYEPSVALPKEYFHDQTTAAEPSWGSAKRRRVFEEEDEEEEDEEEEDEEEEDEEEEDEEEEDEEEEAKTWQVDSKRRQRAKEDKNGEGGEEEEDKDAEESVDMRCVGDSSHMARRSSSRRALAGV